MNQELLESVLSGADALCEYCGGEGCDNCIVLSLRYDAQDKLDGINEEECHIRSSTYRDYGPSNPWDAPGMSVKDFI